MLNEISGIILAGGASRRFGGATKSLEPIEGQSIISRITKVLRDLFPEIIIVTNNPEDFSEFSHYMIVSDQFKSRGPLGGIHAGLKASTYDSAFIIAGDMPYPDKNLIISLSDLYIGENYDALIPQTNGRIEPLHGLYKSSVAENLEKFLSEGKSNAVRDFLDTIRVYYPQLKYDAATRKAFTNINCPADIQQSGDPADINHDELTGIKACCLKG